MRQFLFGRDTCLQFIFLVLLLFTAPLSLKATDWAPINQDELKMKDLPEQPGAPAFVLYHEQIDDNALKFKSVYVRMKVLTEAGRKYADVQIPYNREAFTIDDIKGRTIHSDGTIVDFQGKPFDKVIAKGKYLREQVKSFTLPDVQVGSVLEYRYSVRYQDQWVFLPRWELQNDLFQKKLHFRFVITTRQVMDNRGRMANGVSYSWLTPKQVEPKWDNRGGYDLNLENVAAFTEEEHMLPARPFMYFVNFYYQFFANPDAFWKEEGKFWSKDVERFIGKKGGVSDAVNSVTAGGDTPEAKVKKIYAYVGTFENLTYRPQQRSAEELKVLGMKNARGAEDVLRQKSGDRDDLTRTFVAMVRAAGIPAWTMRVTDRSDTIFLPNFLEFNQLDAEVAIVKLNDKEVFLDPGTKYCPYGILYWKYSGSRGIRESAGGGTELAATPPPQYTQAMTQRLGKLKLSDQGQADGALKIVFSGQEALQRRMEALNTDDVGRTQMLEDEIKSWLPAEAQVSLTNAPEWQNSEAPLVAQVKVSTPLLTSAGKRLLMPMNVLQFNKPPMFSHSNRTRDIYFEFPSREIDEITVVLPDNLSVETLPAKDSARLDYALFGSERKQSKNEIVEIRDLAVAAFVLPMSEYKNVKGFYDKVKESDDQEAILTSTPHVAQN